MTPEEFADRLETFGKALQILRTRRGLKQREVEEEIRLPRGTLSNYERGHQGPPIKRLFRILDVLGASFTDLDRALAMAGNEPPAEQPAAEPEPPARTRRAARDRRAREPRRAPGLPAELIGHEIRQVLATMLLESIASDPQGVIDAMRAPRESAEFEED